MDIRTGETLWTKNDTNFSFGQIYDYESPNQHGGIPYLWGTVGSTYKMYDAFSGDWILDVTNVPSGTRTFGSDGSILIYTLSGRQNTLTLWNMSKVEGFLAGTSGTSYWQWRPPQGETLDGSTGYMWNLTVPDVPGEQRIRKISSDVIYARTDFTLSDWNHIAQDLVYSIKPGEEGTVLWGPINRTAQPSLGRRSGSMQEGVFSEYIKEKMAWYAYDIYTGDLIWGPSEPHDAFGSYDPGEGDAMAYGKLFSATYDGYMYCFDLETGYLEWKYFTESSGFETPYGHWPFPTGSGADRFAIADGKLYAQTGEHSPSQPLLRGERLHCISAETGIGVWNITGWYLYPCIADGYLVIFNQADNRLYCFGKGQTTTTVTVQNDVISKGNSLIIKGTVMDQSPGAEGTPAIADDDMTAWMEYLYMQKPMPMGATGVEVTLETLDPNGNFYEIGKVTSDASGMYSLMWEPPVPGKYTIIASFAGSESYWRSTAETAIGVTEAATPAQPIEPEPAAVTEAPFTTTEVAIISVIVVAFVVGITAFWILRKRK